MNPKSQNVAVVFTTHVIPSYVIYVINVSKNNAWLVAGVNSSNVGYPVVISKIAIEYQTFGATDKAEQKDQRFHGENP